MVGRARAAARRDELPAHHHPGGRASAPDEEIVEGEAVEVTDADRLGALAEAYRTKYDDWFGFRLEDGRFTAEGAIGPVLVYDVQARKAFGFTKGDTFSQTRWRF